ncbi:MAG: hypothetical protein ACQESF_05140 [Nanobdellota archaeon]
MGKSIFDKIKEDLEKQVLSDEKVLPEEYDEFYPNKIDEKSSFINNFIVT